MPINPENFQMPSEFADYQRRLIIYSNPQIMRDQSSILLSELKNYGALDRTMDFEIGTVAIKIAYLADENISVAEATENLQRSLPAFRFEPDAQMALAQLAIDDPHYPQQWALRNIEAEAAWERAAEVSLNPVTVAIIDSGIQRNHEDLPFARISGLRVITPAGSFTDDTGHGTMIAGVIGAIANNNRGIAGVARNVDIVAVEITDERTRPTVSAAIAGISYALARGAKVINLSWHLLADNGALRLTIGNASLQCVVVVAAGNYGSNNTQIPTLPASYSVPDMIVAMASDRHDVKCWFSNYGVTSAVPGTGGNRRGVDLAAPGVGIRSTGIYYVNPRYPDHSGTSVAAAYLSGAAALLLAIDSSWTPQEIHVHLNESVDRLRSLKGICNSNGRLNLRRAICGPFQIVAPAGGLPLPGTASFNVRWTLEYPSTIMTQAEISVRDAGTKNALGPVVLAPAASLAQPVPIPNAPGTPAFIRVRGVRGSSVPTNLYTDSDVFLIT